MKEKVILVDGHNLLFRMYFGIPSAIRNSKGKDIRGLVGFIGSLKKIVNEFRPNSIIVIFDSETSRDSNLEIDINYKGNRVDYTDVVEDDNPFSQLSLIYKALDYLEIPYLEVFGNEADDYIASLCRCKDYEYVIVSTDSDFIQLVNSHIKLFVPRGKNSILFDENKVFEKYHVFPSKYVMYKALVGDKSDNISGIRGIGPVIAGKILEYDSIDDYMLENDNKISRLLEESRKKLVKNIKLITFNSDIDTSNMFFHKIVDKIFIEKTYEIIEKINEK